MPTPRPSPPISRRAFVVGASAAGALLAAGCASSTTTTTSAPSSSPDTLNLILRFDQNSYALSGVPQRLVASVLTNKGEPPASTDDTLTFQLTRDGKPVGEPIPTAAHADGVPIAYYPVRTTIAEPGTYALTTTIGGTTLSSPMQVADPGSTTLVLPGQPLPVVNTPTVDDPRGVNPICTRKPEMCEFHTVDLAAALAAGSPTALLVSTPQFCQIGVCGPVLNLLMESRNRYPGITMVHAEVFANLEGPPKAPTTPTVDAMGLTFEPSLFLVGADGVVRERLDSVFDRTEIAAALDAIAA